MLLRVMSCWGVSGPVVPRAAGGCVWCVGGVAGRVLWGWLYPVLSCHGVVGDAGCDVSRCGLEVMSGAALCYDVL